ncbi:GCP4 [Scenedesmus sp. PABB004]|nr:GCP4 [Scenedesmus sp. PABB004]
MPGLAPSPGGPGPGEEELSLQSLMQELLMALLGLAGDVFVELSAAGLGDELLHPERCSLALAPDIAWVCPQDRAHLNELVALGFHYRQLQRFIAQEGGGQPGQRSLYRQALCAGLAEVLAVYEDEVVALQESALEGGAERGLPGLAYQLADLQMLLPQLHQLAYDLRRRAPHAVGGGDAAAAACGGAGVLLVAPPEARGARLLATLHAHRLNGQPLLQACLQRLLWHVNQVLFNQLTMWMVHGLLADEGGEFFIRPREPAGGGEHALGGDDAARDGGAARDQGAARHPTQCSEDDTYRDWHEAFEVALHELPPGVTPHLATSVEFVGRAVRLLRAPPASAKLAALAESCAGARAALDGGAGEQTEQQGRWREAGAPQDLLPHEDTLAFAAALRGLAAQPALSQAALERTVEAIRADVASRLWRLLVVQAGLVAHLGGVKDYCLLARGDFWQCFLTDAARLLAGPPREKTANADLAVPWQSAAAKSTAAADPRFKLFRIVLRPSAAARATGAAAAPPGTPGAGAAPGSGAGGGRALAVPPYDAAWDELRLEASLPWPLGVLLTRRHMERYNALFQLLLRLKRVQLALEQAWQELGRLCGRRGGGTSPADITPLLQLRQHMGHLVGNLQIYLQLDVVETNYARLVDKVAAAQDFAEAEHAHERFLHALLTQSFLSHTSLVRQLGEVFGQTSALCRLVRGARERGIDWEQAREVHAAFDRTMSSLYVNLQSRTLQQYDKAPYLRQLYLRLDFNGYIRHQNMRILAVHKALAPRGGWRAGGGGAGAAAGGPAGGAARKAEERARAAGRAAAVV